MSETPLWKVLAESNEEEDAFLIQGLAEIEGNLDNLHAVEVNERQYRHQQQLGGGDIEDVDNRSGRFRFLLEPVVDRRSQSLGVHERIFRTRVRQEGQFIERQSLSRALVQGLRTALEQLLDHENMADWDRVYFTISSNRLHNAYSGCGLRAREWRNQTDRVDAVLHNLRRMLNSNEQFEMDDSCNLSFVHVRDGPYGGGKRRLLLPGNQSSTRIRLEKQSVIPIPQTDDNLCCGRAIVTAKAHADGHPQWRAFQRGRRIQLGEAMHLHEVAGVPPGMCGPPELRKFAEVLPGYKIVVVGASRNYHCYVYGEGEICWAYYLTLSTSMPWRHSRVSSVAATFAAVVTNPTTIRDSTPALKTPVTARRAYKKDVPTIWMRTTIIAPPPCPVSLAVASFMESTAWPTT